MTNDQVVTLVFDALIAIILAGVPFWLIALWRRRSFFSPWPLSLRVLLTVLAVTVWATVLYGSFIEPRRLVVRDYSIDLRPAGSTVAPRVLNLAVISDLHFGFFAGRPWADRLVSRLNALHPDAVLMVGDIISNHAGLAALPAFRDLQAPLGQYAVLGNWDYHVGAVGIRQNLGSYGVKTLVNRRVMLGGLALVGIDDVRYGHPDWAKATASLTPGQPWLAMVHEPEGALWGSHFGAGLVISGHTHGGQIRLPYIGSVSPLPSRLGEYYDMGLFDFYRTKLLITSGTGEDGPRARLFDPPEIMMVQVKY